MSEKDAIDKLDTLIGFFDINFYIEKELYEV